MMTPSPKIEMNSLADRTINGDNEDSTSDSTILKNVEESRLSKNEDGETNASQITSSDTPPASIPAPLPEGENQSYHPPYMYCMECSSCNTTERQKVLENIVQQKHRNHSSSPAPPEEQIPNQPSSDAPKLFTSQFRVEGICCPAEIPQIRRTLRKLNSTYATKTIFQIRVNITSKLVYVQHTSEVSAMSLSQNLERNGFPSTMLKDGLWEEGDEERAPEIEERPNGLYWNVILSGIFWFLSMFVILGDDWANFGYFGLLSVVFGLPPIAKKTFITTCRRKTFDANCMMFLASIGALALGEYDEAASVSFLFSVSQYLEHKATYRAQIALGEICNITRGRANIINADGSLSDVKSSTVPIGSVVFCKIGEKIPMDGVVMTGSASVDESSLTGESRPNLKSPNNTVHGGSLNLGPSPLSIRTTSLESESALSKLVKLVEEAQSHRSPTEKLVDKFARRYTPCILFIAAAVCLVPVLIDADEEERKYWLLNGLIFLVVACPCALTISTPVTYAAGLAASAQRGVIVKGGAWLEALGHVKKIVFDKTGTLTEGKFSLLHMEVIGDSFTREQVLHLLALMEEPSSHPLSNTLIAAAQKENIKLHPHNYTITNHTILPGEGLTATIDSDQMYVGNKRLFKRLGFYANLPPEHKISADIWSQEGGTVGFIGSSNKIHGIFCVTDKLRREAREVVRKFKGDMGMHVVMLTGDSDGAALSIAQQVGIAAINVKGNLLPEDKLKIIKHLKQQRLQLRGQPARRCCCRTKKPRRGNVLMIGDGLNDAPALATADIGVAMGHGAATSMEMSDITLLDSDLNKLVFCVEMGQKVLRTIRENISFSLLTKICVVSLTFSGNMTLFLAIVTDVGVMLLVTLNGMKLLPARNWEGEGWWFSTWFKPKMKKQEERCYNLVEGLPEIV